MWTTRSISLRRILSSACWALRSIRRLSVRVLYSPSVCWLRSLVSKKVLFSCCFLCLLSFSLVFGIDKVYADDGTATPEPTLESLIKTPTPKPTLNTSCHGIPQGWGTVTPYAAWSERCYQCLPLPTMSGAITPTPDLLAPTATATLPALTYWIELTNPVQSHIQPDQDYSTTGNYAELEVYSVSGSYTKIHLINNNTWFLTPYYWDQWTKTNVILHTQICNYSWDRIVMTADDGTVNTIAKDTCQDIKYKEQAKDSQVWSWTGYIEIFGASTKETNLVMYMRNYAEGTRDSTFFSSWNYHMGNLIPPTPTPSGSICDKVQSKEEGQASEDTGLFSLPDIKVGVGSCNQYFGWTIGLSWVANLSQNVGVNIPESLTIPGIIICIKPIYFGELNLFGLTVNLDIIAVVMGVVVLLRIILRS